MLFNRGTDRPRPAAEALAVIGAFTALTLAVTYPLVHEMTRALPSDLGDPLLNAWILAWDAEQLLHGLQGLWDAPIFYPYPKTLTYSENLLGIAVLTAPVQWLTGNPVLGYNVAFLFSYVLAGSGMYLLAVSITGNRLAAVVSGVAFAFLPYRVAQLSHLQVLMFGWMPIGLWALHRFFRSGSRSVLAIFVDPDFRSRVPAPGTIQPLFPLLLHTPGRVGHRLRAYSATAVLGSARGGTSGSVPHPVPWTHICAMPPGVAHTPRAPRSAFDTQASRDARSGCTAPQSRPRRRGRPRGSERFGRGSLAP